MGRVEAGGDKDVNISRTSLGLQWSRICLAIILNHWIPHVVEQLKPRAALLSPGATARESAGYSERNEDSYATTETQCSQIN